MTNNNPWLNEIIEILTELDGAGTLRQIKTKVMERNNIDLSKYQHEQSISAQIRKTIYYHSSECDIYKGEQDLFYAVNGKGNGCWGLRDFDNHTDWELIDLKEEFSEGKQILRTQLSYERNNKVIRRAKEHFKQQHGGKLFCEICGFDFHKTYGELGKDYIEGHHTIPVSQLKEGEKTRLEDIIMVCCNCHRMLHRRKPWLSIEELKLLLNNTNL
ncbi:HNH endonuclease [Bacillus thuringiensis]|uniref:HNH endonuclease n=1 Tax=Bacillus thuringiensis TaxID=1428 RepID=UPI000BF6189B|nr:HNH endonuclease [Bacillus thuringiensis]PFL06509.1 restriction endonuclease [Bacillus thuringiensis]PGU47382.1 restriction endonuclease [Bacillus thuringiensis]